MLFQNDVSKFILKSQEVWFTWFASNKAHNFAKA